MLAIWNAFYHAFVLSHSSTCPIAERCFLPQWRHFGNGTRYVKVNMNVKTRNHEKKSNVMCQYTGPFSLFTRVQQAGFFFNIDMWFVANCRYRKMDFVFIYDTWRYLKIMEMLAIWIPTKVYFSKNYNPLWIAIKSKVTNIESISRVETKQKFIRIILWGLIWWSDLYHGFYDSL